MEGKGRGYHGHSREHGLHRKGISTKITEKRRFAVNNYVARGNSRLESSINRTIMKFKSADERVDISDEELLKIEHMAKEIVDNIPPYTYHRVNFVDFMNMLLKPEKTPHKLCSSTVFLSEFQLEKGCTRSGRDVSIKLEHYGCPIPKIYVSPFKDERNRYLKEEILQKHMVVELENRYGDLCPDDMSYRDIIIGGNYPEEHEITYVLPETKEKLADKVVEIIVSPDNVLYGIKENLKSIGYPELADKVRHETPEDSYEINKYLGVN